MNSLNGYNASRNTSERSRKSVDSGDIVPTGQRVARLQNYTPQAMEQYENMFQHVGPDSYLSRLAGGDQSMFDELEAPAWQQFQQAQGQLASRFSGQGMGGRSGSAFQNAGGQLANDFAMNLQSQRMGMRNQALKELMGYSDALLNQKPYEKAMYDKPEGKKNFWQKMGGGALRAAGTAAGTYFGSPQAGYAAGNEFANAFGV
jgi:hypothetical protein